MCFYKVYVLVLQNEFICCIQQMVVIIIISKDYDVFYGDVVVNDWDFSCQVEVVVVREIVFQVNVVVFFGWYVQMRQMDI